MQHTHSGQARLLDMRQGRGGLKQRANLRLEPRTEITHRWSKAVAKVLQGSFRQLVSGVPLFSVSPCAHSSGSG